MLSEMAREAPWGTGGVCGVACGVCRFGFVRFNPLTIGVMMVYEIEVFIPATQLWTLFDSASSRSEAYARVMSFKGVGVHCRLAEKEGAVMGACEACGDSPANWEVRFTIGEDQFWCYACLSSRTDWVDSIEVKNAL